MKNILFVGLSITAALLTACGGSVTPPASLNTLTLGGVNSPVVISGAAHLAVTATDTSGQPFSGTPIFTSSDPNVIAVAADGTLTVRHLSTAPVTLTVAEGGKTATLALSTYGLDVVGGTYALNNGTAGTGAQIGTGFFAEFRDANGHALAADTALSIQGPTSFNGGAPVTMSVVGGSLGYTYLADAILKPISGTYTATLTSGTTTFTKTFAIDAASVLPNPTDNVVKVTATGYTTTGTLPSRASSVYTAIADATHTILRTRELLTLPDSGTFSSPLPSGTYYVLQVALSYSYLSNAPFPDQINRSATYLGPVTIP